jgi:hypothetical protein
MAKDEHSKQCPVCSSGRVASISWGLPADFEELRPALDAEEIILGGCDISDVDPRWHCFSCEHRWGIAEHVEKLKAYAVKRAVEEAEKERRALARGVMEAIVKPNGYAKCPHCGATFSTRHDMSWDGVIHKTCKTRLNLSEPSLPE